MTHNRRRDWHIALNKCCVRHDVDQKCQLFPSVSCGWSFCAKVTTANCGTLMSPISLESVPTHDNANDLAVIDFVHTSMIEL